MQGRSGTQGLQRPGRPYLLLLSRSAEKLEGGRCTEGHSVLDYLALHSEELRYSNLFLEISSIPFGCHRVR